MATTRVAIALPKAQVDRIRALIRSRSAAKVSALVNSAVDRAIQDSAAWQAELNKASSNPAGH